MKKLCGSGSVSDPYPFAYIVKKKIKNRYQILDYFTILYREKVRVRAGARTGAASCWCSCGMKKQCVSGSGFSSDPYPLA
jgi:hypothetical protein